MCANTHPHPEKKGGKEEREESLEKYIPDFKTQLKLAANDEKHLHSVCLPGQRQLLPASVRPDAR